MSNLQMRVAAIIARSPACFAHLVVSATLLLTAVALGAATACEGPLFTAEDGAFGAAP